MKEDKLDIVGLSKTLKAVPKEVYVETTKTIIARFNDIVAPITETTSGLGRYIKQKFDNMVETEKALSAFTIERAIEKASKKGNISPPSHIKSFIKTIEEASKETDSTLHEMWVNILSSQLTNSDFHPRYVNILSNFSASEAKLLLKLNSIDELGEDFSIYFGNPRDFKHFVIKNHDTTLHKWEYSCNVLLEFEFAEVICPNQGIYDVEDEVTILYRTKSGTRFLNVVTNK